MLGFNWVDVVIVAIILAALVEGLRLGLVNQLAVIFGFFVTLFVTGWLFPYIVRFHDPTTRTVVNASLVLLVSMFVSARCSNLGRKVHQSFRWGKLITHQNYKLAETILGGLPAFFAAIVFVWLTAVMLGRMPFVGLSNSVNDAKIVQKLTRVMPPVPAVFAEFGRHINPNNQPQVKIQTNAQTSFDYDKNQFNLAAAAGGPSVVRITSFGCGGIVAGSGFVAAPDVVATNAHVIAGTKRPIIKYNDASYEGIPIYFDANLDLALLQVKGLQVAPINVSNSLVSLNSTVAILGYPKGNYTATPGIIRDTRAISGTSIYNLGSFGRGLYEIQSTIDYGNSGSPVVAANGQAVGIIFSKSDASNNVAFALTSLHINDALMHAQHSTTRVGTGACVLN